MQRVMVGAIVTIAGAVALSASSSAQAPANASRGSSQTFDTSGFATECGIVETEVGGAALGRFTRAELLVMMGRSSAATGRFGVSAAAYLTFLNEFGLRHEWAERVSLRLIDSLAPLKLDVVDVMFSTDGPQFRPAWRMGYVPDTAQLEQAVTVCETLAAELEQEAARATVLLKLGWIQRARGDWDAATRAWDRAAVAAPRGSNQATQALSLAAENCEWLGHPTEAIARLEQIVQARGEDAMTPETRSRIERLRREAGRDEAWLADPVAGFQREGETNGAADPSARYVEAATWLKRRGQFPVLAKLAWWASREAKWPLSVQLSVLGDLADASLAGGTDEGRVVAAEAYASIIAASEEESWILPAAVRRSALLRVLHRPGDALSTIESTEQRLRNAEIWETTLVPEKVRVLLDLGDMEAARTLVDDFGVRHSDHPELPALRDLVQQASKREGK
ncbi:MAG: hypothetical protein PVJ57_22780 [Phycisphaerae bacterium]|jgi:hypothetical protein